MGVRGGGGFSGRSQLIDEMTRKRILKKKIDNDNKDDNDAEKKKIENINNRCTTTVRKSTEDLKRGCKRRKKIIYIYKYGVYLYR